MKFSSESVHSAHTSSAGVPLHNLPCSSRHGRGLLSLGLCCPINTWIGDNECQLHQPNCEATPDPNMCTFAPANFHNPLNEAELLPVSSSETQFQ